jgi:serine phosphatase RsbU (regulator of sigma subunit)
MRDWLFRCPLADPDLARRWRLVNTLVLSLGVLLAFNGLSSYFFSSPIQGLINVFTLAQVGAIFLLNRRGWIDTATWALVGMTLLFVVISSLDPTQGLMSAVIGPATFVVPIAVSGILISWRALPAITAVSAAATAWLYLVQLPQMADYRSAHPDDTLSLVIGLILVFLATAVASWLANRLLFDTLRDLRLRNGELEQANVALAEGERLQSELAIARAIQQDLLPGALPVLPGVDLAAECRPAREMGGDSYDLLVDLDGVLHMVVSDACGKSVPAALLAALNRNTLRAALLRTGSPAAALTEANGVLTPDMRRHQFVAVNCLALVPASGQVRVANAGQVYPVLARRGPAGACDFVETPAPRLPLGLVPDLVYEEITLTLQPGDLLVASSDGLIDARNAAGEPFGFVRLTATVAAAQAQPTAAAVLADLLGAVSAWADPAQAQDDITAVVLRWCA